MSSFIDAVFILKETEKAEIIIRAISSFFAENGIAFSTNSNVIYNDFAEEEREPETLSSEDDALKRILLWPTLGGLTYRFTDYTFSVFLFGIKDFHVDALSISMSSHGYLKNSSSERNFNALIVQLHHLLQAKRTILGYELLSPNSFWIEELGRVQHDVFTGEYVLDLR